MATPLEYIRYAWRTGIYRSVKEVLKALRAERSIELSLIDLFLEDIRKKTAAGLERITEKRFKEILLTSQPNLYPLKELLLERNRLTDKLLNDYRFLIAQNEWPSVTIGRRGMDIVRNLSLETLEKGFLQGNPTAFSSREILSKLLNAKISGVETLEQAERLVHSTRYNIINKIPVFHEDGRAKFMLHIKTKYDRYDNQYPDRDYRGVYRAWDAAEYSEMVAKTTAHEAYQVANIEQAKEVGTRLLRFNSTGKGQQFYVSIEDPCSLIDGATVSIVPGTITGKFRGKENVRFLKIGKNFFPYLYDLLTGGYVTPHPNCRHIGRPEPEENYGGMSQGQPVTAADLLQVAV